MANESTRPGRTTPVARGSESPKTETDVPGQMNEDNAPKLSPTVIPTDVAEKDEKVFATPVSGDVPDPRTESDTFKEGDQAGFAGLHGFAEDGGPVAGIPYVDPKNIPAEVTPAVQPNADGNPLLAAAQAKAPNLTAEFVRSYKLTDSDLAAIALGQVPPPPAIGPAHTSDLYLTPGGWVQTAPGVSLESHAAQQASRRQ